MIRKKIYSLLALTLCLILFTGNQVSAATGTAVPSALGSGDYAEGFLPDVKFEDAASNATFTKTNGDGWYDVGKLDQMYIDDFDTSGLSGTPISVTLKVKYSVASGYTGPNPIKWTLQGGTLASTGITPVDGENNVVKTFNLFSQGVDTLAEIATLDIQFRNDDAGKPSPVAFDYVQIIVETTSGGDTTPPAPPTNIMVTDAATGGRLDLSWTNPTDADFSHIHIYRSTSQGTLGNLVYDNITGTSQSDTGLTNGTTYYYTLRSIDTSNNESTNTDQYNGCPTNGSSGGSFSLKGIEYVSWWNGEYSSTNSDTSLTDLKNTNSTSVGLIVTWYMDTGTSSTIYADASKTPTDADVIHAITDIHAKGMSVMLKPHLDSKDGTWRGSITPSDTIGWFNSYNNFITHYAQIAKDNGVEYFSVATELKSLSGSTYSANWNTVIDNIKAVYTGPLTYAANWNEYTSVSFWNRLDYAGIDAYFPLSDAQKPPLADLINGWTNYSGTYGSHNWVAEIESWQASINKPVIFTEIGYRSVDYAAKEPWVWGTGGTYNGQLQSDCYQAAIEVFKTKTWFSGLYWWDWLTDPNAGGAGNTDYTPQNKPAETTLTALYGGGTVNNPPNVPAKPSGPTSGTIGQSYTYSTSTTDPDGDQVKYVFDWGDGTTTTTGYFDSGVTVSASHSWGSQATYTVRVKAIDSNLLESAYSAGLSVRISRPKRVVVNAGIYEDLSQIRVYPNPYKANNGGQGITFDWLCENVDLVIYNIAGELIYQKKNITGGSVIWDLSNNNGESIASGIYIYLLKDTNGDKQVGKIGVIR